MGRVRNDRTRSEMLLGRPKIQQALSQIISWVTNWTTSWDRLFLISEYSKESCWKASGWRQSALASTQGLSQLPKPLKVDLAKVNGSQVKHENWIEGSQDLASKYKSSTMLSSCYPRVILAYGFWTYLGPFDNIPHDRKFNDEDFTNLAHGLNDIGLAEDAV